MSIVTAWVKDIFIVILSITFIEIQMAAYLKFIFSMIILAVILSPLDYLWNK